MYLTRLASLHRVGAEASVLVNALSGAVDVVDNELRSKLLGLAVGVEPTLSEEIRRALTERRYLLDNEREERAALAQLYQAYRLLVEERPRQFVLALTHAPNLICAYGCGAPQVSGRGGVTTPPQVRDAFAVIAALAPARPRQICYAAACGDASLLPALAPALSEVLACAQGAGLTVETVGSCDSLSHFLPLFARYPEVMRVAHLTVDACAGRGPTWDHVISPIERCLDAGLEVTLCVTVGAEDLPSIPALRDLAAARGWLTRAGFQGQVAPAPEWSREEARARREDQFVAPVLALWRADPELRRQFDFQLFRTLHHLLAAVEDDEETGSLPRFQHCDVDRGEVWTFAPDGLLYLCPESTGDRRGAVGCYSPRYRLWPRRLSRWQNRSVLSLPECRECNIATFCGGGCAYAAAQRFGTPAHGLCGDTPEIFKAYFRHLPERLPPGGIRLFAPPEAQA